MVTRGEKSTRENALSAPLHLCRFLTIAGCFLMRENRTFSLLRIIRMIDKKKGESVRKTK